MISFIFLIVIAVLLVVSLDRFSRGSEMIREQYLDLKFINYNKDSSINCEDNLCNDIYNENDILEVVNSNPDYASYQREINVEDFLKVLESLKKNLEVKDYFTNLYNSGKFKEDTTGREPSSFSIIKKRIIKELSDLVQSFDDSYNFIYREFTEDNSKILKHQYYREIFKYIDLLDFLLTISREDKNIIFTIKITAFYDYSNFNISVKNVKLIGITTYENSTKKFFKFYRNKYLECDKNNIHHSLSKEPLCDESARINFKEFTRNTDINDWNINNSKCFFKEADNKIDCLSTDSDGKIGIWDTRCRNDYDCPYFGNKGNTNYPNNRGGCNKDGYCELPLNMKSISYRKYDKSPLNKPLCHNCPDIKNCVGQRCNQCCDIQENPDYAFKNDTLDRTTHRESLISKGLKIFGLKLI